MITTTLLLVTPLLYTVGYLLYLSPPPTSVIVSMVSTGSLVRWYHPSDKLRAVWVWTQPFQVPIGQASFFDWFSGPGDGVGGGKGKRRLIRKLRSWSHHNVQVVHNVLALLAAGKTVPPYHPTCKRFFFGNDFGAKEKKNGAQFLQKWGVQWHITCLVTRR